MRKRKHKLKAKFYWNLHNFHAWNGYVIYGKDRAPRLLKHIKPTRLIYAHWYFNGLRVAGLAYYLGNGFVYIRDALSGFEYLVMKDHIERFSIPKFAGCKDIFHEMDEKTFTRAQYYKEQVHSCEFIHDPLFPIKLIYQPGPYD